MQLSFIHASSDPLLIIRSDGRIRDLNAAARAVLAPSGGDAPDASLSSLLGVSPAEVARFVDHAGRGENALPCLQAPANDHRPPTSLHGMRLEADAILIRVGTTSSAGADVHPSDLTVAERLSRTQNRYEALFNGMNDAVLVFHLDPDSRTSTLVDANDAAVQRLGYSREELLQMRPEDIADTSYVDIPARIDELRKHGRLLIESCHVRRDGHRIPVEVSAHLFDLDDRPTVLAIYRDISERKRIDKDVAELFRREKEARRDAEVSREQLAFLVQATSILSADLNYERTLQDLADLVVPHLADWCLVFVSGETELEQVAISHHDLAKRETIRRIIDEYPLPLDNDTTLSRVIRTGEPEFLPHLSPDWIETTARDENHRRLLQKLDVRSLLVVPISLRDKNLGALVLIYGSSGRNYTRHDLLFAQELAGRAAREIDNARLFRAAEQARDHAEEMNRLKSAFLANMSHEIRTPLTSILGFASLLEQRVDQEHRPLVEFIQTGGQRLLDTLDAVLSLSLLESDMKEFELEPVDVGALVEEIVALIRPKAVEKNLTLTYRRPPGRLFAEADSGAVTSVLQNLIGNAIKFTQEGGVDIVVRRDGSHTCIDVIDTGVGMEPDFTQNLFQPFYQESTGWSRSYEGTGLGLAITKRLVDGMNGRMELETTKHQGSRFSVMLRTVDSPLDEASDEDTSHDTTAEEEPPRILLVEDNPESGMFMEVLLSEFGEVTLSATADEARTAVNEASHRYDVLILDINLGNGTSGADLLEELRTRDGYAAVPAAAVTAYAMPGDRDRLLASGFDAYLSKPFSPDDLSSLVQELLSLDA